VTLASFGVLSELLSGGPSHWSVLFLRCFLPRRPCRGPGEWLPSPDGPVDGLRKLPVGAYCLSAASPVTDCGCRRCPGRAWSA